MIPALTPATCRTRAAVPYWFRSHAVVIAALAATVAGAACSTVHLEDPPADVNACRPSQMFFVERIWPEFLAQSYNGQTCGDSSCHDNVGSSSRRPLNAVKPTSTDMPSFPFVPGSDWEKNYLSVTRFMICTNVRGGELFTRPAGLRTHAAKLIDADGPEALLLEEWVSAP